MLYVETDNDKVLYRSKHNLQGNWRIVDHQGVVLLDSSAHVPNVLNAVLKVSGMSIFVPYSSKLGQDTVWFHVVDSKLLPAFTDLPKMPMLLNLPSFDYNGATLEYHLSWRYEQDQFVMTVYSLSGFMKQHLWTWIPTKRNWNLYKELLNYGFIWDGDFYKQL